MTSQTTNRFRIHSVSAFAAAAGVIAMVAALSIVGGSSASAAPAQPCAGQTFTASSACTLEAGEAINFTVKAGNGGAGGNFTGSGGAGGLGGAGGKVSGTFTNTSGSQATLTVLVGANGAPGVAAASPSNGSAGSPGTDTSLVNGVADDTIVTVMGGFGGTGGLGNGTAGTNGYSPGFLFPMQLPSGWVSYLPNGTASPATTWTETPRVILSSATPPTPDPVFPPGAPTEVKASSGNGAATVQWLAPVSIGSFPITNYQVTSSPGNKICLATAPALSCEIAGLANGTAYTFTVRALNGAGWGPSSEASSAVTPAKKSIVITGSRDGSIIKVAGRTAGLVGAEVTPWVKLSGESLHQAGTGIRTVTADGTFAWSRKTGKSGEVYFESGDVRSNVVAFRAR